MRYSDRPSYRRSLRAIGDRGRLDAVEKAVEELIKHLETQVPPPAGLGLKQLQRGIWEIRSSLADRVAFGWKEDIIVFLVAGRHDEIRRLLKRL